MIPKNLYYLYMTFINPLVEVVKSPFNYFKNLFTKTKNPLILSIILNSLLYIFAFFYPKDISPFVFLSFLIMLLITSYAYALVNGLFEDEWKDINEKDLSEKEEKYEKVEEKNEDDNIL